MAKLKYMPERMELNLDVPFRLEAVFGGVWNDEDIDLYLIPKAHGFFNRKVGIGSLSFDDEAFYGRSIAKLIMSRSIELYRKWGTKVTPERLQEEEDNITSTLEWLQEFHETMRRELIESSSEDNFEDYWDEDDKEPQLNQNEVDNEDDAGKDNDPPSLF